MTCAHCGDSIRADYQAKYSTILQGRICSECHDIFLGIWRDYYSDRINVEITQ